MNLYDTVAAVSTPRGKGGVAMIRISGDEAVGIADRVFFPKNGKRLSEIETGRAVYGSVRSHGEEIDDGMAVVYRAPRSFTGEDTVEVTCHGGILVTAEVLSAFLSAGARAAEAGEFTRRAFLSGKLGLSEAEALGALLEADTAARRKLARAGLSGKVSGAAHVQYNSLCRVMSHLYAVIDYPDEDLGSLGREELRTALSDALAAIRALADTYQNGKAILEGVATVLCGKPNVGKSSLYNRMVDRDAAIVTSVAGTTRDLLEETVPFGGVTLRLCDTAGLHDAKGDIVEEIGMERAAKKLEEAELILAVFDASRAPDEADQALLDRLAPLSAVKIALLNKSDKTPILKTDALAAAFDCVIPTSAETGEGLSTLREAIDGYFLSGKLDPATDPIVATARQHAALRRACEFLMLAIDAIDSGISEDLVSGDVEAAMSALAELDGRAVNEDIVSGIFSHFCVGK